MSGGTGLPSIRCSPSWIWRRRSCDSDGIRRSADYHRLAPRVWGSWTRVGVAHPKGCVAVGGLVVGCRSWVLRRDISDGDPLAGVAMTVRLRCAAPQPLESADFLSTSPKSATC